MSRHLKALAGAAMLLAAAACSHGPSQEVAPLTVATPPVLTLQEHSQSAIQLLDAGEEEQAMAQIAAMLEIDPKSTLAIRLRDQVEKDPQLLLGKSYKPYTVKAGDTLSSLAKTYLGDAMHFYALSRYNGLEAPNRLQTGQTLKMPDSFKTAARTTPAETSPPVISASAGDIAAANALRLQALSHLNGGNADEAVALLIRARKLDSSSTKIANDLAKAERIQKSLGPSS